MPARKSPIERSLAEAHAIDAWAGGELAIMIARKKFSPTKAKEIISEWRRAATVLENILEEL